MFVNICSYSLNSGFNGFLLIRENQKWSIPSHIRQSFEGGKKQHRNIELISTQRKYQFFSTFDTYTSYYIVFNLKYMYGEVTKISQRYITFKNYKNPAINLLSKSKGMYVCVYIYNQLIVL